MIAVPTRPSPCLGPGTAIGRAASLNRVPHDKIPRPHASLRDLPKMSAATSVPSLRGPPTPANACRPPGSLRPLSSLSAPPLAGLGTCPGTPPMGTPPPAGPFAPRAYVLRHPRGLRSLLSGPALPAPVVRPRAQRGGCDTRAFVSAALAQEPRTPAVSIRAEPPVKARIPQISQRGGGARGHVPASWRAGRPLYAGAGRRRPRAAARSNLPRHIGTHSWLLAPVRSVLLRSGGRQMRASASSTGRDLRPGMAPRARWDTCR